MYANPSPRRALLPLALLLAACSQPTLPPEAPTQPVVSPPPEPPPTLRLPGDVRPLSYSLALRIDPSEDGFAGDVAIEVELDAPRETIWLHAKGLDVQSVLVRPAEGEAYEARFEVLNDEGLAAVRLPAAVQAGRVRLELAYSAPYGTKLRGLYKVVTEGEAYAFTQFEPVNAREAFPCFDEPLFKTPFDVQLTVPEGQVAIANTLEQSTEPAGEGMVTHHFATTAPLPTYLVAFAAGPLDVVDAPPLPANAVREHEVPFRGVAVKGRGEQMRYALEQTPAIVEALEQYFGLPYPYDKLDILAVPDFAAGAMENAGAITFREYFLLFTDEVPERQRRLFAEVMAHELAHQWFGNLVTMPYWNDIWLNEAFATWMAARTIDSLEPSYQLHLEELRYSHWAMRVDELQSARSIRQPIQSQHDIENAFDAITYTKGGAVLNMFEQYIGADTFQRALQSYMREHAFGSATAEDLVAAMSEAAGEPLTEAFFSFLTQPGVPLVQAEASCEGDTLRVSLAQQRYVPLGGKASPDGQWKMPVCVRYEVPGGDPGLECTMMSKPEEELEISVDQCPQWWMPNGDARGYYRWTVSGEDFAKLTKSAWDALDERERQSTVESLTSSFRAGEVEPTEVFPLLFRLIRDGDRHVVSTAYSPLAFTADHLLDETQRSRYRDMLAAAVVPRLRRVGYTPKKGEPGEQALLRQSLVSLACLEAQDPGCRRRLGRAGRARLGLAPKQGPSLPADLIGIALQVAVQEGDERAFARAVEQLFESSSSIDRGRLLSAIGSITDPELAARARPLTLDPRLRVNEVRTILSEQVQSPEQRRPAWEWMLVHREAIAARTPSRAAGRLVSLAKGFCSKEAADEVREKFGPHADQYTGGPRELANTLETIELCAARAEAARAAAQAYFSGK